MAERKDDGEMNVDDCAKLSRTISAILDVEDPITSAYVLEVSSPGIDRPLVRLEDFTRFAGFEAKIELRRLIDGRRRYTGHLAGVDGDNVLIETESRGGTETVSVPFAEIDRAKLMLTDELIEATLKKRKH
jgi:ribosome maturation factor RimP